MTQKQLEDLFWRATVMCLGLNPDSEDEAVHKRVRISWPTSETGSSNWQRDENVVFLRISPGFDTYGDLHEIDHAYDDETDQLKEVVQYYRCHKINWVCYGPDSDDDADAIRIGILRDAVHSYLKRNMVAVKPHIREPLRMTEQDETGEWWERCDLHCECYQLVSREYDIGYIDVPPDIYIIKH